METMYEKGYGYTVHSRDQWFWHNFLITMCGKIFLKELWKSTTFLNKKKSFRNIKRSLAFFTLKFFKSVHCPF